VVVFLTGTQAFPEGYGGQVYFNLPDPSSHEANWSLLGHLTNNKPSVIFKISNLKATDNANSVSPTFFGQSTPAFGSKSLLAQIGISIETLTDIEHSTPVTASRVSTVSTFIEFSEKMLENFFNYTTSFNSGIPNCDYIPISLVKTWYENFQRRLHANPYFWRS